MKDPNKHPVSHIGMLMVMFSIVIFIGLAAKAITES